MNPTRITLLTLTLTLASLAAPIAQAHEGHDHADEPAASTLAATDTDAHETRATTASENFEAVAVLSGQTLRIYLDRYASNAPVTHARLNIEGGGLQGQASEVEPGVYVLPLTAPAPARWPLTLTIEAAAVHETHPAPPTQPSTRHDDDEAADAIDSDLLNLTLEQTHATAAAPASRDTLWHSPWAAGLGVAVLAGLALLARPALRRNRRKETT